MSRASIAVAAFSTVVEWYDFTLYLYFATVLSRVFFGASGTALSMNEDGSLRLSTVGAVAVILVTPFVGAWSDRLGRKPVLICLSVCSAILPITLFHLMAGGSPSYAILAAVILACVAGGVSALGAIATAEQFPGEGRISGLALGATSAAAIFGGLTPYVAQVLTQRTGWIMVPGAMIAVVAVLALPIVITLPETAPSRARQVI